MLKLNRVKRTVVAAAAMCLSISAGSLWAQTLKGTILGTITDTSGAVIPRAQVIIVETGTNTRRAVETNDSGFYAGANLDPGVYRIEVEHTGFRRIVWPGIDLPPNNTARVDLELSPATVSEVVEVAATTPLLQTDRSDTGGQLQTTELQNMPLA